MKKTLFVFMFVFVFVSLSVSVSAATENETVLNLTEAGMTPDNAFYFLDLAFDNLGLALTFNNDLRIKKELKIAEERLSEAREMAIENKTSAKPTFSRIKYSTTD